MVPRGHRADPTEMATEATPEGCRHASAPVQACEFRCKALGVSKPQPVQQGFPAAVRRQAERPTQKMKLPNPPRIEGYEDNDVIR